MQELQETHLFASNSIISIYSSDYRIKKALPQVCRRERRILFRVIYCAAFPDKIDLYLTRVFHFVFYALGDVAGKNLHAVVGDSLRLDHDTNLAACLNSVGFLDPVVGAADLLELFETLYVVLVVLASCCGAGCADRVGCLYERCDYRAAQIGRASCRERV